MTEKTPSTKPLMESRPEIATGEDWRLGAEPEMVDHDAPTNAPPLTDTSNEQLERPVAVITVDHLAWALLTVWTLLTRLIALDARPLSGSEAANGLFGYDLAYRTTEAAAAGFHPTSSGWVHLLQAGIFALTVANHFTARALYVLSGMLLVAMSFAMRRYIRRAGAIGMGTLLAISPTITWFSRAGELAIISAAAAVVTLVIFMALCTQPSRRRAAALGIAGGLMIASGPIGLMFAVTMLASIVLLGVGLLFVTDNAWLRTRVWLDRYRTDVAIAGLTAATSCLASQYAAGLSLSGFKNAAAPFLILGLPHIINADLRAALLPFGFYEFSLVCLGLAGIAVVVALRVRTRLAAFAVLWVVVALALYLATPNRDTGAILIVLLPAALLSGIALNDLYRLPIWRYARYPIGLIALLTIYVQVAINFIHALPDSSEAAWARHANLYWGDAATTLQTKDQTRAILNQIAPSNRTVFNDGAWPPALRWYLRDLRAIPNSDLAGVVVDTSDKLTLDPNRSIKFDYAEGWSPDIAALDRKSATRFFFVQRPWGQLTTATVAIDVRNQAGAAPTLILPPPGK